MAIIKYLSYNYIHTPFHETSNISKMEDDELLTPIKDEGMC